MLVGLDLAGDLVGDRGSPVTYFLVGEFFVVLPRQDVGPCPVTQPVADEILVTGINQDGQILIQKVRHGCVVGLHPVPCKQEVSVDVEITGFVVVDFCTDGFLYIVLVQVVVDILQSWVAQIAAFTFLSDVVNVFTGTLVRSQLGVVTVDGGWNTRPDGLRVVARLDQAQTTLQRVLHGGTLFGGQDGRFATFTASHWLVVIVLGQGVGEPITNHDRGQVKVSVLVGQNLRGEHRDVMASVGLPSDVEVLTLVDVFRELVKKQLQEVVDVLTCSDGVGNTFGPRVGEPDVDRLVKEDHRGVAVPRVRVFDGLQVGPNGRGPQFKEQPSQRGATRPTVQPKDDRVIGRVVSTFEKPKEKMLVFVLNVQVTCVLCHVRVDAQNLGVFNLVDTQLVVLDGVVLDHEVPVRLGLDGLGELRLGRCLQAHDLVWEQVVHLRPCVQHVGVQLLQKMVQVQV